MTAQQQLNLDLRYFPAEGAQEAEIRAHWNAAKTGTIVCDMWDQHWCANATYRVREMTPRMNEVLHALRNMGCTIAHAPSDTMGYYQDAPQRIRTLELAEGVELPVCPQASQRLEREPPMAVDRDHIECDCEGEKCQCRQAWSRQIPGLNIESPDLIGDNLELLQAFSKLGITNVIMMGVHTNMCVVGRAFGIRNLLRYGFDTVLVRDMTDCRAPQDEAPFFNHYTALDYAVRHIERYLCPTVASGQLIGDGQTFRFAADTRESVPDLAALEIQARRLMKQE